MASLLLTENKDYALFSVKIVAPSLPEVVYHIRESVQSVFVAAASDKIVGIPHGRARYSIDFTAQV